MSNTDVEVAVIGAGVVGSAVALALARRGVSVALLEAEPEPGLGASGTNSGILHVGFDSTPGELETSLILRSAALREAVIEALEIPIERCGAIMRSRDDSERDAIARLAENAERNGIEVVPADGGSLAVPGESVTDPIAYTTALGRAAERHAAEMLTGFRVTGIERVAERLELASAAGDRIGCRIAVNCAGLYADAVARLAGDDSFEIYPRKGEFVVFEQPAERLDRILLPVPTERTRGVLVFPSVDDKVIAGPTAVDGRDKEDWSVRPEALDEIVPRAASLLPALDGAKPIATYAGLRTAGRGVNYLIGVSDVCPRLVNVPAIRSTGLTASAGIAERVSGIVAGLGVELGPEQPLEPAPAPAPTGPWWRRVAEHRGEA